MIRVKYYEKTMIYEIPKRSFEELLTIILKKVYCAQIAQTKSQLYLTLQLRLNFSPRVTSVTCICLYVHVCVCYHEDSINLAVNCGESQILYYAECQTSKAKSFQSMRLLYWGQPKDTVLISIKLLMYNGELCRQKVIM